MAYYGISSNLVNYLTDKPNVSAARNVNTWQGTAYFIPLISGFIADTFLGRFWTIGVFSVFYLLVSME